MYEVWYAIGGWDADLSEPVGGGVPVEGPVDSLADAQELMVAYAPMMGRRYGDGVMVILDAEAGRWKGENVRVEPQTLARSMRGDARMAAAY